jgi:chemotaxis protein histidine kinase CheA
MSETSLLAPLGEDRELARIVVQSAAGDLQAGFARLAGSCGTDGREETQRAAHQMKGLAAQVGALSLAEGLKALEADLKAGQDIDAARVADLRVRYDDFAAAAREWLA